MLKVSGSGSSGFRVPGMGNSHGARPVYQNHLDDEVDSDQQVVNKELSQVGVEVGFTCR